MKDTLRTIELLEEHIDRLAESGIYEIERDLLLERLRGAYATALSIEAIAEEEIVIETLAVLQGEEAEPAEEPAAEEDVVPAEEPAEEQAVLAEETNESEAVDEESERDVEDYPVDEPMDECMYGCPPEEYQEIPEESEAEVAPERDGQESLFALYEDDAEEAVEDEPAVVVEVPTEQPATEEQPLFEENAPEQVEENVVEEPFVDEYEPEERSTISLRNTIGVNDKIILMRDLFNGNSEYYDRVINTLDSFDSLDEAMIYIHDNYHWNPQTEGARLLVELLAHKLF
ncbi:MAG: hypothetical protein J6K24_00775 [Tidjanibacter sp.]|nr:hypothetical protein [Tidjanibacter sp.]